MLNKSKLQVKLSLSLLFVRVDTWHFNRLMLNPPSWFPCSATLCSLSLQLRDISHVSFLSITRSGSGQGWGFKTQICVNNIHSVRALCSVLSKHCTMHFLTIIFSHYSWLYDLTLQHALQGSEGQSVFVGNTQGADRGCDEEVRWASGAAVLSQWDACIQPEQTNRFFEWIWYL